LPEKDKSRRRRLKGPVLDTEEDSTKAEAEYIDDRSFAEKFLYPVVKAASFLTGWINPINAEYGQKYSYSYNGLKDRAALKFRFGLTEDPGASMEQSLGTTTRSTAVSRDNNLSLRSGTTFLGGIKTDVGYSRRVSQDIIKVTNPRKILATNFPDIKFTIRPLTTFTFLNPFIKRFSPRTGFTRSTTETFNLQTGLKASERQQTNQKPLLALSVVLLDGVQVSFNTDHSVSLDKSFNSQSGETVSRKKTTSSTTTFSVKYSFTSPSGVKIPVFGRVRFKSTMSLSTDIAIRKQKTENALGDNPFTSTGEKTDFVVSPVISYSFSSQIKGGLTAKWQTTNDVAMKRKSNVRELQFWVDIRF
jgi:hypothetical protein